MPLWLLSSEEFRIDLAVDAHKVLMLVGKALPALKTVTAGHRTGEILRDGNGKLGGGRWL